MKKCMGLLILVAVLACFAGALAEMGAQLSPDAAKVFEDVRWEGYAPVVVSGFGDGESQRGQYAVLMKKGDHNVLCMVEKEPSQSAFAITVETDKAVYQGDTLPSLLIDTGGDVLFYTYRAMYGQSQHHYHTVKREDGTWSPVDLVNMDIGEDGGREMHFWLSDGRLYYQELRTNANDNVISREPEASIPADETQFLLAQFDIEGFRQRFGIEEVVPPASLYYRTLEELPEEVRAVLPKEHRLVSGACEWDTMMLLTEQSDGTRFLWTFDKAGETYALNCQSKPMPKISELVARTEMFDGRNFGLTYAPDSVLGDWITKQSDGVWRIAYFDVPEEVQVNTIWMHGDIYVDGQYQSHWRLPGDLSAFELANFDWSRIPKNKDELLALVNTAGYAMVKSDKATDRLNLRAGPSRDSVSYGKYYSGTPVRVLETQGDWCKVTVGGVAGYMQRQYLAFGLEMMDVSCYFLQKSTYPAEAVLGIPMHERPDATSKSTPMPEGFHIIAAVGNDWYHVLCDDGSAGYVEVSHFWDGNG